MEFSTIILRFRDLVTEENRTIELHKRLLKVKIMFGGDGGIKGMKKCLLMNLLY